jgi:hypothetical protein
LVPAGTVSRDQVTERRLQSEVVRPPGGAAHCTAPPEALVKGATRYNSPDPLGEGGLTGFGNSLVRG